MPKGRPLDVARELLEAFEHSGSVNEYLVNVLSDAVWRMIPPDTRGRSIRKIVAHMQGVRRTFARMGGIRPGPPSLDGNRMTRDQARRALRRSRDDLAGLFEEAITAGRARIKGIPRRVPNMLVYLLQHDAHHRGQICMLAKELGHEFRAEDTMRIWGWKALPTTIDKRS
jgi:uncharacterized damage-inducible protein DinB